MAGSSSVEGGRAGRRAVVTLLAAQTLVFSGAGWLLGAVLDIGGALNLSNSLFVSGLLIGLVAGLVALEGSDLPAALNLRAARTVSMFGLAERPGLGLPLSRVQALAVVSAGISAAGLVAGAILLG